MTTHRSGWSVPFPTTRWSQVAQAKDTSVANKRRALQELLEKYMPAIRSYLRFKKGLSPEDASDLTQGFVVNILIEKDLLARADPSRGKLRGFLLKSLNNFATSEHRRNNAQKRTPGRIARLDDAPEPKTDRVNPSDIFEVQWARSVVVQAVKRMQQQCEASGRSHEWFIFKHRLLGANYGGQLLSYKQIVQELDLKSPTEAANLLTTSKRRFERSLRETILEYTVKPDRVDDEIADLMRSLARISG